MVAMFDSESLSDRFGTTEGVTLSYLGNFIVDRICGVTLLTCAKEVPLLSKTPDRYHTIDMNSEIDLVQESGDLP